MDKAIYVVLAVLAVAILGISYTMVSKDVNVSSTYTPDFSEYDEMIDSSLGSDPSDDVRYLLNRPALPFYNYPLEPHPDLEYLVYLKDGDNVNNRLVFKAYKELLEEYEQWFYIYGKTGDNWVIVNENLGVTVFYDELVIATLLVDYDGLSLWDEEILSLNEIAENVAEQFNLRVEYSETMDEAIERSEALADFYSEYDQWVVIGLKADEERPFKGQELHDSLIGLGLKWGEYQNYHWMNPDEYVGDEYLLTVGNMDRDGEFYPEEMAKDDYTTSGIYCGFYLPTCPAPEAIFDNVQVVVNYLQTRLGGEIVNMEGQSLNDEDLARIKVVVGEMAKEMEEYGIQPGYGKALWLFD